MHDIQFKANSGQFNIDQAQGIVECFVAGIGNKDSVGDIVVSGAFAKSLMRRKPRVVWGHNWNDPIGKVIEIYEVPPNDPRLPQKMKMAGIGGLYAKVQFNLNSEKGREAFANVAFFGEEQEWSIGYKTLDAIYDNSKQANILREVELYELSPVLHGANQLTGTISVKSDEEKMHMHMGMGMPSGMIAVAEKPKGPVDPFEQGIAQPADSDRMAALERELSSRTDGPIKVMKANESSVVFLKPGKGMFRLGYYFDGEQYMFGKPEKLGVPMMIQPMVGQPKPGPKPQRIPNFPNVEQKPSSPIVPVKYGNDAASGFFSLDDEKSLSEQVAATLDGVSLGGNQADFVEQLSGIVGSLQQIISQHRSEKSELLIQCPPEMAFETKQALDPVFDYHRIESYVTEDGIVIASPLTGDAYEAVENATKSLLGRIGRGIGGGGKVRRGRAALSRIEGVLDPRSRRDVDGDGLIFDGTWMEQPDPTRFVPRVQRSLRSGGGPNDDDNDDDKTPRKPKFVPKKVSDKIEAQVGRSMNKKIIRMFDELISRGQIPEDSIVRQIADGFKNAKREGSQTRPDITPEQLEAFKSEFERLRPLFAEVGALKEGEKGASPFDVLSTIVTTGKFRRVNKGTGSGKERAATAGMESAATGVRDGGLDVIVGTKTPLPKLKRTEGKLDVSEFIETGLLPKNWEEMTGDEQVRWISENEDTVLNAAGKQRPWRWTQRVARVFDRAYEKSFDEDERRERLERRAREGDVVKPSKPQAAKPQAPKPQAPKPPKPKSDNKFMEAISETLNPFVERNKQKLSPGVVDAYNDMVSQLDEVFGDEDMSQAEKIQKAQEIIDKALRDMTITRDTNEGDPSSQYFEETTKLRELNKTDNNLLSAVQLMLARLSDEQDVEDREDDLDAERDMEEGLARRARRARRYNVEDDEDFADGAEVDYAEYGVQDQDIGDEDDRMSLRSSGRRVLSPKQLSVARNFQSAHRRRKSNGTLRSSGKSPRTEITQESTWWKKIDDSLDMEIRKSDSELVKEGLNLLQQKIKKYEAGAFKPNSKRTNVGSIKVTADEADKILDAIMSVIDRQQTAGKGGTAGSRGELFAELLETLSKAAMSTFIDKTSPTADDK